MQGIEIEIDELTPCLVERATGREVQTSYSLADKIEMTGLKRAGWLFDWTKPFEKGYNVYKLTLADDRNIQGLVAVRANAQLLVVEIDIAESAPDNMGSKGKFAGVGGHLFAIAAQSSFELGFDGYVFFITKTQLMKHYIDTMGAQHIGNRKMVIDTLAAKKLIQTYLSNKEGSL